MTPAPASSWVATAEQVFGPPAVMIANAGIVPNASVLNMDVSAWDAAIETNLRGVFLSCQAAARSMVAMELAEHRINVNSVSPGVIDVHRPIPQGPSQMNEEFRTAVMQAIPWGRRGQVDEVADAVLYLCSPGAEYITGALLPVDGGSSTGWTHMPYSSPQSPEDRSGLD